MHLILSLVDPREYSISTKEFVVDEDGKLKGLNTSTHKNIMLST